MQRAEMVATRIVIDIGQIGIVADVVQGNLSDYRGIGGIAPAIIVKKEEKLVFQNRSAHVSTELISNELGPGDA